MGPISELILGVIEKTDVEKLEWKLGKGYTCQIACNSEGQYIVRFPPGSIEEMCAEPDPRYREETVIKLRNGATLRKCVKWPCTRPGCTHTYLFLPDEPEDLPRRRRVSYEAR